MLTGLIIVQCECNLFSIARVMQTPVQVTVKSIGDSQPVYKLNKNNYVVYVLDSQTTV